jgi:phage baseplate assembly protein W
MATDFLGKGWLFPVDVDDQHRVKMSEDEANIQQSIWIILATAPGERMMRPDFGCGIHRLVFAVDDAATRGAVVREVRQALISWEPRVEVLDVGVETKYRSELLITISYRVRTTNNFFNLVFPFYLQGGIS